MADGTGSSVCVRHQVALDYRGMSWHGVESVYSANPVVSGWHDVTVRPISASSATVKES